MEQNLHQYSRIQYLFPFSFGIRFIHAYIDVEMSVFARDDLHPGHDMIEELVVDLLRQGLGVRVSQRDVQQLHKGLDGPALQTRIQLCPQYANKINITLLVCNETEGG
jgi:hypothetical protein